jgi:hypothetical protein
MHFQVTLGTAECFLLLLLFLQCWDLALEPHPQSQLSVLRQSFQLEWVDKQLPMQ